MIRTGDLVTLSPLCQHREWFPEVRHLVGKEFPVVKTEGEYITFLCKDGKGRGPNREYRRWHTSNLVGTRLCLENK